MEGNTQGHTGPWDQHILPYVNSSNRAFKMHRYRLRPRQLINGLLFCLEICHGLIGAKSLQPCLTLYDSMDWGLPGSFVHGILQARILEWKKKRILEWVAISSSRGSSGPRDRTRISCISCIGRRVLYHSRGPSTLEISPPVPPHTCRMAPPPPAAPHLLSGLFSPHYPICELRLLMRSHLIEWRDAPSYVHGSWSQAISSDPALYSWAYVWDTHHLCGWPFWVHSYKRGSLRYLSSGCCED